jgi:hypothetical protein
MHSCFYDTKPNKRLRRTLRQMIEGLEELIEDHLK